MKKILVALAALGLLPATAQQHMRISFPGYDRPGAETLHNFPALVVLTNNVGGTSFKMNTFTNDGYDLRFKSKDGTPLDYEIDTYEPGERLLAWVKVPELEPDGSTFITASWGDPQDFGQLDCTTNGSVWADHLLVHHYAETALNAVSLESSTAVKRPANFIGQGGLQGVPSEGKIGMAAGLSASGNTHGIELVSNLAVGDAWSVSVWFKNLKPASLNWRTLTRGAYHHILVENGGGTRLGAHYGNPRYGQPESTCRVAELAGTWRHLAATYSNGQTRYYLDGMEIGVLDDIPGTFTNTDYIKSIGCNHSGGANQQFAEFLDEFRVATVAHSPHWVWAAFMSEGQDPGFTKYEEAGDVLCLVVDGNPKGVGEADPAFGMHWDYPASTSFTATASAVWTNPAENTIALATGWEFYEFNGQKNDYDLTDSGNGDEYEYTFQMGVTNKLVWVFAVSNLITVTQNPGGNVSGAGWCLRGESLVLTATPAAGNSLLRWLGDVDGGVASGNTLTLPGDKPRKVSALFENVQHVALIDSNGNPVLDDSNDGFSWATPKQTVQGAVAALGLDHGLVLVTNGNHLVTGTMMALTNAVTIRGVTGNPLEVQLYRNGGGRIFHLDHPDARVESVTVRGGFANDAQGGNILIGNGNMNLTTMGGGTVTNCVIAGGSVSYWGDGGGVTINSIHGLVTHSVISNNWLNLNISANNVGGAGVRLNAGRLEHSLIVHNRAPELQNTNKVVAGGVCVTGGSMVNCTVAGNTSFYCGGVHANSGNGLVINTVIAGNTASEKNDDTVAWFGLPARFVNCFTDTAAPINATCTNFTAAVLLTGVAVGDFTPAPYSPLIDAGIEVSQHIVGYVQPAVDLAGKKRVMGVPPVIDVGCYESDPSQMAVSFVCDNPEGIIPARAVFEATLSGAEETDPVFFIWDFGEDNPVFITDAPVATNTYHDGGTYFVTLIASNATTGATATVPPLRVKYAPRTLHVWNANTLGTADEPYDDWANAAATIQDAVDYAVNGCEIVIRGSTLEYIGNFGTEAHRSAVNITKALRVYSEDENPASVVIRPVGSHSGRAMRVSHAGAWVSGVTLTGGWSDGSAHGKGVFIDSNGGVVSNCVIRGNDAGSDAHSAGAFLNGTLAFLTHCVITNNTTGNAANADHSFVRVSAGRVENSLIAGNRVTSAVETRTAAVEVFGGEVAHCTIVDNATTARGVVFGGSAGQVVYCVIAGNTDAEDGGPAPLFTGNDRVNASTTDSPMANGTCRVQPAALIFKDYTGKNYRLGSASLAINAGPRVDPAEVSAIDLDGQPRVQSGYIDHGCYEANPRGTLFLVR